MVSICPKVKIFLFPTSTNILFGFYFDSVYCTVYTVHFIVYTLQCTVSSIQGTGQSKILTF